MTTDEGSANTSETTAIPSAFPAGWMVAAAWLLTFVLAYVFWGRLMGIAVEGVDFAYVSKLPFLPPALALLAAIAMTVRWAGAPRTGGRKAVGGEAGSGEPDGTESGGTLEPPSGRRRFLVSASASAAGIVGAGAATFSRNLGWATVTGPSIQPLVPNKADSPRPEWEGSRVQHYRRLGRTNFMVSDISLGSSKLPPEADAVRLARGAIERGVNYFDTAPDYANAGSELALGKAMKGRRDEIFLATKFCTPNGHIPTGSSVETYMEVVEESLKRLQTDYVDLVHIHSCDSLDRLMDPNVHEAFDRLKEQGKARFLGVSTHTPGLETIANEAIESDRFDVMMLAYHHGAWPNQVALIDHAAERDVAVVAMKTLKGARHQGLLENRAEADSYTQAAFKWVLGNPSVSCLVVSFREWSNLDEYLYASGNRVDESDIALLQKYDGLNAGRHCYQHCGACLASCPEDLAIDDILRHRMYFEDYRDEKEAMRLYAKLERQADRCLGCSAPCTGACPHGIPIQARLQSTHHLLT